MLLHTSNCNVSSFKIICDCISEEYCSQHIHPLTNLFPREDYKTPNEELYQKIQQVYSAYFKPEMEYKQGAFQYANALRYGYVDFQERKYDGKREFTADEYAAFCGTHCTHIVIPEPYKSKFFDGLRQAVLEAGDKIVFYDTFVLFTVKKPL